MQSQHIREALKAVHRVKGEFEDSTIEEIGGKNHEDRGSIAFFYKIMLSRYSKHEEYG
jgi:hypothetical protein